MIRTFLMSAVAAIALTSINANAFEAQLSSKAMLEMCQNSDPESVAYNTCMSNINGYMAGLVHAKVFDEIENNTIFSDDTKQTSLQIHDICLKPYVSNYQLAQVFIQYGRTHPEKEKNDFFSVLYDSMRDSFPCKASESN